MRALPLIGALLAGLVLAGAARAADYLEDARTARAVGLVSPRAPLRECLRLLSEASGVRLTASADLGEDYLTAYVPKRPLRETMEALRELYDASWTPAAAMGGYQLAPLPRGARSTATDRAGVLKAVQKALDEQAAAALKEAKGDLPIPDDRMRAETMALILWNYLTPPQREEILRGSSVTIPIPEARSRPANRLAVAIAASAITLNIRDDAPPTGPPLATFDLDDMEDRAVPALRARITTRYENCLIAAIGLIDLTRLVPAPKLPEPEPPSGATLPADIGEAGRFSGTRDEVVLKVGAACNLPVLSRHRAYGGSSPTVSAGGRKVSQVMGDLAAACEANATATSRGFYLLRSRTEALDASGFPPAGPVQQYLRRRPKAGVRVPFAALTDLAAMTPLQISVLERCNVCSSEAEFAYNGYALLRFYRALQPAQRDELFSTAGLDVAALPHEALHALVDQKIKRGEFDIFQKLQEIRGLRFRFQQFLDRSENSLVLQALRGTEVVSATTLSLPEVEEEAGPVVLK